jgi:phosphoglycolate phosphatase-like HAD superfamily hydrolase
MSPGGGPRIVLDFEGVICDSVRECRLITWLGANPPGRAPVSSYLMAVPPGFTARFGRIVPHARMLEHFMLAHYPVAEEVSSRAEFDAAFAAVPAAEIAAFTAAALAARERFRAEEPAAWACLHPLYPGVAEVLREHPGAFTVATARDTQSVRTVLDHHGLGGAVSEIAGGCWDKAGYVLDLCRRLGLAPRTVAFVDDNIRNVTAVAATGASAHWAMWGHRVPEDLATARTAGVDRLELPELGWLARTWRPARDSVSP